MQSSGLIKSRVDHLGDVRVIEVTDDPVPVVRPIMDSPVIGDRGANIEIALVQRV